VSNRSNRLLAAASRTRLLLVLMLLAMVLASVNVGVSAQTQRDVNSPAPDAQPDRIVRPDGAIPGIYHIDYLDGYYNLDPAKYPIDGSIGFWHWSMLNPANGKYDWDDQGGAKRLDNWIKSRVDRSATVPTGVGIMLSSYDTTTAGDILSTPNWVIKLPDAVIPATTQSGAEHYIDYYFRTSRRHMNGEFENSLNRWVVSNSGAVVLDSNPPGDSHVSATPTMPDRPAKGNAVRLGGADNINATLAKDSADTLDIPAMPPSLNGKQNVYVYARVNIQTTDPNPNDQLYFELWDVAGNKLGGTQLAINNTAHSGQGANYWKGYTFDITPFATEKKVRAAFRVVTDGANPTTFWVDNVQLRVRHLIPKYWGDAYKNAYKTFITALGNRYKTVANSEPLNGQAKYGLQFVAMGTGAYGENQPAQDALDWEYKSTFDHVVKAAGMDTSKKWQDYVNEISQAYATAFASGDGTGPARHLFIQYAPSFMSGEERGYTTDYAASRGIGLSHNRLLPEFIWIYRNDKAGFYDPIRLWWNTVPTAVEAYATDLGCSPVMSYWALMAGLEKHIDFIRTDPELLRSGSSGNLTVHAPLFDWASNFLGKTVQNTPKVWTVLREHRNPMVASCTSVFYQTSTAASNYPQYGNFNYWLYQLDTIAGGRTVAETNDKGADVRFAKDPANGASRPEAGLGNCPDRLFSDIYAGNPPTCNPRPYNENLPPLVGQSESDYYNPATWTGAGKEAWVVRRTDQQTNNPYMFFRIEDGYMGPGAQTWKANITVKYFDIGTDKFSIKYDSVAGEKIAGVVTKTGSKQLKTITFTVNDAKFANRLPGSTDFYLDSRNPDTNANDGNEWLHMIEVEKLDSATEPTPTPTVTVTPTPSTGSVEGLAFNDLNKNGKLDAGEPGVADAVMSMSDLLTPDKYLATSEASGLYRFTDVNPGQYTLKQKSPPPGFKPNVAFALVVPVQANSTWNLGTNIGFEADGAVPTVTPTPTVTPNPSLTNKTYLPVLLR
jgi:hypothetical protein